MRRSGIGRGSRLAAAALAVGLVLSLAGDGGRAATVPANIQGQDPLEVLALKVRPNVIVVLDSSGSMMWTLDPNHRDIGDPVNSGDHPRSKLYQAKQVLKTIVQDNQDQASFLFGQYTQGYGASMRNRDATHSDAVSGQNRFMYWTSETLSPSMATTELSVERASGDPGWTERGLQSWQWIDEQWDTLWFDVGGGDCTAVVPAGFYASGASLATALQNAMNGAGCGSDYRVTYDGTNGRFSFSRLGGGFFDIHWSNGGADNIAEALGGFGTDDHTSDVPYTLLFRADTPPSDNRTHGDNWDTSFHNTFNEEVPPGSGTYVTNYQLRAGRFFNGEVIRVTAAGEVCDVTPATAAERTNPPTLILQEVAAGCGADVGNPVTFNWAGAFYTGGDSFCNGFQARVDLVPCDLRSPAPTQFATIGPWLDNEAPLDADGSIVGYSETMDGSWGTASYPAGTDGGIKASGSTPIAASLQDIRGLFSNLWYNGQAGTTNMAGPPPYQLDAIRTHVDPKEKTIVLFITDGDDTCASGDGDAAARSAAYQAEQLYTPREAGEPSSSVQTYVIGYGGGATGKRLNWIAWGGSGLGQGNTGQPDVSWWGDPENALADARSRCTTCEDAFIAPDASALASTLQAIIDQGAGSGEFTAQQAITESVYEYVDLAGPYDARSPSDRYKGIVPTRFVSSFTLPGFKGQLKAYQNAGDIDGDGVDDAVQRWSAGDKLLSLVSGGMSSACDSSGYGGGIGQCVFPQLHAGATDATIASSSAAIKRRVYTTDRNGVYDFTPSSLMATTANSRVTLWPPDQVPTPVVAPTDYSSMGQFDEAMGLPSNSPTSYPPQDSDDLDYDPFCDPLDVVSVPKKTIPQCVLQSLQQDFDACVGTNLPSACTDPSVTVRMMAARREARDIILAFMAGATTVPDANVAGVRRTSGAYGGAPAGSLLFRARSWVLADSEFATAAVVTPPLPSDPVATPWTYEYDLFRRGKRDSAGTAASGSQIYQGFGLRDPDQDQPGVPPGDPDPRAALKPVMTVLYAPGNDMLHAFRAGPNCSPSTSGCAETGGEELWGFVPYDQLEALRLRVVHDPQGRDNHVYMIARGIRFSDVFVPAPPASPLTNVNIGGETEPSMKGVWRRILYFGRGIAGKYLTALDVTAPGPYTADALDTTGPIPLWSRGNPDTEDGTGSGPDNNDSADRIAYAGMGQTWSIPAVGFIENGYSTTRPWGEVNYILAMGSGYGDSSLEGSTFYTLDALSGDVVAAVDVEAQASASGWDRPGLPYDNALVANAVGFNPGAFSLLTTVHPAAAEVTRFYIGDIHGRFWKFLTANPTVAIPVADVGEDQPIGTAASLLGMPPDPDVPVPYMFVASGNDQRVEEGPFKIFAFRDDGEDTDLTVGAAVTENEVEVHRPVYSLYTRAFDQGDPEASCGYAEEAWFRGTVQPAAAFECPSGVGQCTTDVLGRVFFAGTRLSDPNTVYAPPTPLACGLGDYPCRSQFDSIIYALGAKTGLAAYDMNSGAADDAYRIFRDSRLVAIGMQADPDPGRGGASFTADEGLVKGVPKPPPPPGVPPQQQVTQNVVMAREAGQPPPSVHYGSTVCQ